MSDILERWRGGEGFPDVMVIDGHLHAHAWPHGPNFDSADEAAAGAIAAMDANGVDLGCVLSGGYMGCGSDYTRGNGDLRALCDKTQDRLVGFAHINPNDSLENIRVELDRIWNMGFRCIKLLNSYQQAYPSDGPNLMEVYRFAAERNVLIINHSWGPALPDIARRFPDVDLIMAHYGESANPVLREHPNVYASIWNLGTMGFLERGVREAGPEKFLLGSDAFMNCMSVGIGMVVYADMPDEHKRMILGLNQARLLDKVGALPRWVKERYGSG